ncbi:MAG: hypothetical protein AB2565_17080 [Candidatus Thiodiazotropha endolucinida]|uniref:Uncharacterized protein n=2 Tax=Candidatus Thiodiazotropha TaxID=1913444 RepID=A0A7Z0VIT4_9GAMM|nr:hypothetical protein [Candidatus Thiodiazotropha endolucinida]ODJ85966.1 hypothetical protein CODIS_37720 [Candidatus Thiodiazotropha endolucinida]
MNRRVRQSQPPQPVSKIAEPDTALKSYLDTLLSEIDDLTVTPPQVEVKEPLPDADINYDRHTESTLTTISEPTSGGAETSLEPNKPDWVEDAFQV